MTLGTGLVVVVAVIVIGALLLVAVRPRRRRLVNHGRRPRGYGMRRAERIKRAAARDIALIQGKEPRSLYLSRFIRPPRTRRLRPP